MSARLEAVPQADERLWLRRAVLVLAAPRSVFAALRDDSEVVARTREEAVLAIVFLAGIGTVLWTPVAGRFLEDVTLDWLDVAVWAFLTGGLFGFVVYWPAGAIVHWVSRLAGGSGSYRRARHLARLRGRAARPLAVRALAAPPRRLRRGRLPQGRRPTTARGTGCSSSSNWRSAPGRWGCSSWGCGSCRAGAGRARSASPRRARRCRRYWCWWARSPSQASNSSSSSSGIAYVCCSSGNRPSRTSAT